MIKAWGPEGPIKIPTSEELRAHHEKVWEELGSEEQRNLTNAAILALQATPFGSIMAMRKVMKTDLLNWSAPYHFFWGMGFRNDMRKAGISDLLLPTKNLDDYYVKAAEIALEKLCSELIKL